MGRRKMIIPRFFVACDLLERMFPYKAAAAGDAACDRLEMRQGWPNIFAQRVHYKQQQQQQQQQQQ